MNNSSNLIELINRELESEVGVFVNPKTGNAWEVYLQDGELFIEVPNFSFQIYPLRSNRFRPVGTLINLEIEFEKSNDCSSLKMHIYAKGVKRATFFLF